MGNIIVRKATVDDQAGISTCHVANMVEMCRSGSPSMALEALDIWPENLKPESYTQLINENAVYVLLYKQAVCGFCILRADDGEEGESATEQGNSERDGVSHNSSPSSRNGEKHGHKMVVDTAYMDPNLMYDEGNEVGEHSKRCINWSKYGAYLCIEHIGTNTGCRLSLGATKGLFFAPPSFSSFFEENGYQVEGERSFDVLPGMKLWAHVLTRSLMRGVGGMGGITGNRRRRFQTQTRRRTRELEYDIDNGADDKASNASARGSEFVRPSLLTVGRTRSVSIERGRNSEGNERLNDVDSDGPESLTESIACGGDPNSSKQSDYGHDSAQQLRILRRGTLPQRSEFDDVLAEAGRSSSLPPIPQNVSSH